MARNNKGIFTKQKILQVAKELYYQKGYCAITVQDICKQADVGLGTFTYYFTTKESLVSEIYSELLMKSYAYVNYLANRPMNHLERNVIASFLYYNTIYKDEQNLKFHYDVFNKISNDIFPMHNLKRIHMGFVRDFNLDIDDKELLQISTAELGVRRQLTLEYIEHKMFDSPLELVITIYKMMGRLFTIDESIINEYISRAVEFLKKNDLSRIKFLV